MVGAISKLANRTYEELDIILCIDNITTEAEVLNGLLLDRLEYKDTT